MARRANRKRRASSGRAGRLYSEFAAWWPLLSAPSDYAREAAGFRTTLLAACSDPPRTLLELGSGGGNTASHLKKWFRLTLTDLSPRMLDVSRALNPECEHIAGDMRTLRLGREFDAVFAHDAIMYLTTKRDLAAALKTAFIHCRRGGAALFAPDFVRETFEPGTDTGGTDGGGRGLAFLEWIRDLDPADTRYEVHYAFLLRDRDDAVRVESERHDLGLFPRATWLRLLRAAGFKARVVKDSAGRVRFVGVKS